MKDVEYFAPKDTGEATKLLAQHGENVTILAGGTDVVPKINYYDLQPDKIMYIGDLGLSGIKESDGRLIIGAAATTAAIAASDLIVQKASALAEAARETGSVAIRTTATIGGNLGNASPGADMAPPLLVMDAQVQLTSSAGNRTVAMDDFFVGPGQTVMKADELLTEISMPVPKGKTVFLKLGRRKAMTLSVVNVAVNLEMDGNTCTDARIAIGSMAPKPLRCTARGSRDQRQGR